MSAAERAKTGNEANISEALAAYAAAFCSEAAASDRSAFLTFLRKSEGEGKDKDDSNGKGKRDGTEMETTTFTRTKMWALAKRAAGALKGRGLGKGDAVTHYFTSNSYLDVAFRLGSTMVGSVPVTVNWQADTPERVVYKIAATGSKLLLVDDGVPAEVLSAVSSELPRLVVGRASNLMETAAPLMERDFCSDLDPSDCRIVIFTSGTTGKPKGVRLPYSCYECNKSTFEQFLEVDERKDLITVIANPMHHTNSTAIVDWATRRPNSRIVLFESYTNLYWSTLVELANLPTTAPSTKVVCPSVSRHFDFLDSLATSGRLPCDLSELKRALGRPNTHMLLGSAPVGPATVSRLRKYAGKLPVVRFGSTETCLQVCGTPLSLTEEQRLRAFETGWENSHDGRSESGYYIGREHPGHTEVRVVRSVIKGEEGYMAAVPKGAPGLLITRGANVMDGYVMDPIGTEKVLHESDDGGRKWYTNLGDVGFWRRNPTDGGKDIFWQSRSNALLIKGGANYSYDQINDDLVKFLASTIEDLRHSQDYKLAVVGLRTRSEHEDDCWCTVELCTELGRDRRSDIERALETTCRAEGSVVGKGSRPDFLRFATIPVNFKGALMVPDLVEACLAEAKARGVIELETGR